MLPSPPVMGDGHRPAQRRWRPLAKAITSSTTRVCTAGSVITPPLPTSPRPASNCGLTSATISAPGAMQRRHDGYDVPQRDERHVDGDHVDDSIRLGQLFGRQVPGIHAFHHRDARILPQLPVDLVVPDIDRDHVPCSAREHDVGEAAGRGPDVEAETSRATDVEGVECVRELDAATPDPWMLRVIDGDRRIVGDLVAGLARDLAVDAHQPRDDPRLRPLTRWCDAAGNECLVETKASRRGHEERETTQRARSGRCRPRSARRNAARASSSAARAS